MKNFALSFIVAITIMIYCGLASTAMAQDTPDFTFVTSGQPVIAVYMQRKESYAIGCPEVRQQWSGVQTVTVDSTVFGFYLEQFPVVADIPCDGSIKAYKASDEDPGALVLKHRDGKMYRHYVDSGTWLAATKSGDLIAVDGNTLRSSIASNRGIDFRLQTATKQLPQLPASPKPTPTPTPLPLSLTPNFAFVTTGQPVIVAFEQRKESFAIGCPDVLQLWNDVPLQTLSSQDFNKNLQKYPVAADIPCDGSLKAYKASDEGPGALVFKHRDGKMYRHYVDSPKWLAATKAGDLIAVDGGNLRGVIAPNRGVDFRLKEIPPPPPPQEPSQPPAGNGSGGVQFRTICRGSAIPSGWVINSIDESSVECTPLQTGNRYQIMSTSHVSVGGFLVVCGNSPVPSGWSVINSSSFGTNCRNQGSKTIQRNQ